MTVGPQSEPGIVFSYEANYSAATATVSVFFTEPVVEGADVDGARCVADIRQWVVSQNPLLDSGPESVEHVGSVLPLIFATLPPDMITDSGFTNAEGEGNLGSRLSYEFEGHYLGSDGHGFHLFKRTGAEAISHRAKRP